MTRIEAAALFAQPGYGADGNRADIFAAARAVPSLRRVYYVPSPDDARPHVADGEYPFPGAAAPASLSSPDANPDKVVYLAFTSGTTGTPKGVMHSDNTLLANARAMVEDWGHGEASIVLSVSPMSHHIGTVALAQAMAAGMELVVNDPPPGMGIVDWIAATGATYVMGVPTHAMDVLAEMARRGLDRLGSVAVFYMAGSPIPREVAQAFLDRGITPQNVYGMTENSSHQYTLPGDDARTIVATCGRACRAYEISLWREDDPDVPAAPGTIGEIGGRGACLMLGYFANQSATERSFNRHGWFMSGDLGRLDANGCLEILGRKKDLIIRGGRNIYPARLEDLALAHPGVAKVAAFAVPDPRLGERVCLAVIPREGRRVDPADLLRHLDAAGLSKYDMPEFFIAMDEFPLTASGKILKRELADWAKSGRIAPVAVHWSGPDEGRR
jgi:acyl-CoA synthetase